MSIILSCPEFRVHAPLTRKVIAGPVDVDALKEQAKATEGELVWGWRVANEPWIAPWFTVLEYDVMILEKDGRFYSPFVADTGFFAPVSKFAPEHAPSDILISTRAFEARLNKIAPWTAVYVARYRLEAPFHYSTDERFKTTKRAATKEQAVEFVERKGMTATPLILMAQAGIEASEQERRRYSIYPEAPQLQSRRVNFRAESHIESFCGNGANRSPASHSMAMGSMSAKSASNLDFLQNTSTQARML